MNPEVGEVAALLTLLRLLLLALTHILYDCFIVWPYVVLGKFWLQF